MKHTPIGIRLLRELSMQGLKIFTIDQAKKVAVQLGLNSNYTNEALHHLFKEGWVTRLKKGVYALSASSGFSEDPHEFEIAKALVPSCVISHWTAMHYHHLTQQTPNKIFALVPNSSSIPRSPGKYHFVKIKKNQLFGIEKIWAGGSQVEITDPERTLLDGLMTPEYCGDFQEVLYAFKMRGVQINVERIIQYALRLGGAVIKRLGWVLEKIGIQEHQLRELLQVSIKGYRKLDSSGPLKGRFNKKWMIQENLG